LTSSQQRSSYEGGERQTETNKQAETDKQAGRDRQRQTETNKQAETDRGRHTETSRQSDRQTDREGMGEVDLPTVIFTACRTAPSLAYT